MSIDFIALFDGSLEDISPEWLLERVEARPIIFAGLVERYGHLFRAKEWSVEEFHGQGRLLTLVGPGGFIFDFHPRTIEMWHGIRFSMFTHDVWHREALRHVCFFIAELVRSDRAIYTHELMPYGYGGLDAIEANLREKIGPPAQTFEELDAAEYYGPRAWYIDNLAGLRLT